MQSNDVQLYWIILISFVMPLFLSAVLIWFVLVFQKKKHQAETERKNAKLREQALIISKQQELQNERTRIAAEMHDDLGGGLTTIKFVCQKLLLQNQDSKYQKDISLIMDYSQRLVTNMSEIIWAMNAGFDSVGSLISYCRRYAYEFLVPHDIQVEVEEYNIDNDQPLNGTSRRNCFLIIKEILHNTVKHAQAKNVNLKFEGSEDNLLISVIDNGIGFDQSLIEKGNGLQNISERVLKMNGELSLESSNGTSFIIKIPID